jgi:hypothetical protein
MKFTGIQHVNDFNLPPYCRNTMVHHHHSIARGVVAGKYEACPESKDTSRVGRYGFFLIMAKMPSTLILYL